MKKSKGLIILQVDGLGYHYLQQALRQKHLPFVQSLIDDEGYQALPYRCGIPSTTPFCQAGIIYGNNQEIPAFRWWDKQSGVAIGFGGISSFPRVAHKYFRDCASLTTGGATIATCYPDASKENFRLGYRQHQGALRARALSWRHVLQSWLMNPFHLLDWFRFGLWELGRANVQYWSTVLQNRPAAKLYAFSEMLEEILLHHLTRFAVIQAMKENFPVIYAGFYAYDETSHAFGPDADYSFRILNHVDYTIRRIAQARQRAEPTAREYELIVLSDHGQIETVPFDQEYGYGFGECVAAWFPTYQIEELKGKTIPRDQSIDGHIALAYSGGLAHLYFKDISWRLQHDEIEERFPGLIEKAAKTPGIGLVLTREGTTNVITTNGASLKFESAAHLPRAACDFLARYDQPEILARQLAKLNSFERSGDLILFSKYTDHHQINFETQVGGHGALGGEQLFPFILAKREWKFDTSRVIDASGIYPLLKRLRDQIVT